MRTLWIGVILLVILVAVLVVFSTYPLSLSPLQKTTDTAVTTTPSLLDSFGLKPSSTRSQQKIGLRFVQHLQQSSAN